MVFGSLPRHILPISSHDSAKSSSSARPFYGDRLAASFKSRHLRRSLLILVSLLLVWKFLIPSISFSSTRTQVERLPDQDLRLTYKQAVVDVGRRKGEAEDAPAVDSLERRWEMSSQGADADALVGAIRELVSEAPVVIFSKTHCPFSKAAKRLLASFDLNPLPFIVEADLRPDTAIVKEALSALTSHSTFPNIFIGGAHIGGADDMAALTKSGQLTTLLRRAGLEIGADEA